jgi:eukaryotic-like serine/threonine-protein kinase
VTAEDQDRLVGERYRLRERLAAGGMGPVWAARDVVMERDVALKEMHVAPHIGRDESEERASAVERVRREARAAGRVDHPAVVTIHDVIVHDEHPWIVMELVRGETLAQRIAREGPLPEGEVARIALAVLDGLCAAHEHGVLHRDVKPANVLLGASGRVVLTDFGIARIEGESSLTVTGEFIGSLRYCAPERMSGLRTGPASDLWSLGVLLYEALEGRSPFSRETMEATVAAVLGGVPVETQRVPRLGQLVRGLLVQDPDGRPSAEEARDVLAAAVAAVDGVPDTAPETAPAAPDGPEAAPDSETPETPPHTAPSTSAPPPPPVQVAASAPQVPPPPDRPPSVGPELLVAVTPAPATSPAWRRPVLIGGLSAVTATAVLAVWLSLGTWGDDGTDTPEGRDSRSPTASSPSAPDWTKRTTRTYKEDKFGFGIAVPADFDREAGPDRVTYHDPDDRQVWIEVFRDDDPGDGASAARDWARREIQWLTEGAPEDGRRTVRTEQTGSVITTEHKGERAAQYTMRLRSISPEGTASRLVLQRNLVVEDGDGGMYQLRVSVPGTEDGKINGGGLFAAAEDGFE